MSNVRRNDIVVDDKQFKHLKFESYLYTVMGFVIGLPVLIVAFGIKVIKKCYRGTKQISKQIWENVIKPKMESLIKVTISIITMIFMIPIKIILLVAYFFIEIGKIIWSLFKRINWGFVRSIARIITIVGTLISLVFIVKGFIDFPVSTIITGKFDDPNAQIIILHVLMCYVLSNIVVYYFLWALAPESEMNAVYNYTRYMSSWTDVFRKDDKKIQE